MVSFFIYNWSQLYIAQGVLFWKFTGCSAVPVSDFLPGLICSVQLHAASIKNRLAHISSRAEERAAVHLLKSQALPKVAMLSSRVELRGSRAWWNLSLSREGFTHLKISICRYFTGFIPDNFTFSFQSSTKHSAIDNNLFFKKSLVSWVNPLPKKNNKGSPERRCRR